MKKAVIFLICLILLIYCPSLFGQPSDDPKARAIMEQVNDRDNGDNRVADMEMILIDRSKKQRKRLIKVFGKDKGNDQLMLMFFLQPPDVKDTGFLTHDFDDPDLDDNQWLFLPSLKKTKRIASDDKSGKFMGSDLNYSDMTELSLKDYTFGFYEKGAVKKINGTDTWAIWCIPKTNRIARRDGYDKVLVFVRRDNHIVTRSLAFEHNSPFLKFLDAKKIEKIDGIWVVTRLSVIRKKGKKFMHQTILTLSNVRFNQNLPESLFTTRRMEQGL